VTSLNIKVAEDYYNASYVGFYDIPGRDGVHVFYQKNPRYDLGHSEYFGLLINPLTEQLYVCNAERITEAKYPAIQFEDGFILCSRYRHDFVSHGDAFLDGGLDYTRCSPYHRPNGHIQIIEGKEVFHATHSS